MATNMSTDKNVLLCKKCGLEHERPVGSKCERGKAIKGEKRDTSKETTVRKTPCGKGTDIYVFSREDIGDCYVHDDDLH